MKSTGLPFVNLISHLPTSVAFQATMHQPCIISVMQIVQLRLNAR